MGQDVALLNAMMHTIIEEGLVDEAFVNDRTSGFEELKKNVADFLKSHLHLMVSIPNSSV